jgi:hypothetical protein
MMLNANQRKQESTFNYALELQEIRDLHKRRKAHQQIRDKALQQRAASYKANRNSNRDSQSDDYSGTRATTNEDDPIEQNLVCDVFDDSVSECNENSTIPTAEALLQIEMDLDRTFFSHSVYGAGCVAGQQRMFDVLSVYAKYNPALGYCQGMCFVVSMLLMNIPEDEDAFWCLVQLLGEERYLKGYYEHNLARIQVPR